MSSEFLYSIVTLIGVVIGGAITIAVNIFNNKHENRRRILEEQLVAYKEISKTIINIKFNLETSIAKIAKLKMEKQEDRKSENLFSVEYNKLSDMPATIYNLFSYACFIDKKVLIEINNLYLQVAKSLNPEKMLSKENFIANENACNNVLTSIASVLKISTGGIKIENPNKLINQHFKI